MDRRKGLAVIFLLVLFAGFSCASAAIQTRILSGLFSNLLSSFIRRLWSLVPGATSVTPSLWSVKYESGYSVETVFDGTKLGIEPFSVQVLPGGDLVVLDSASSNVYRIAPPLSKYSRPKLVAGSAEGYTGHVDGKPREARMNHPKGFAVDDKGNIYVADTMNKAIRKISYSGVTTIAGGKWSIGSYADGPSENARFSDDFEVVYVGSSCSLLVVDRGNQVIREIQLNFEDCAYQYGSDLPLGIAMLLAAGFFGYMLAMLQRRMAVMTSSDNDLVTKKSDRQNPYQKPIKSEARPLLIPAGEESSKQEEEGLFASVGNLITGAASTIRQMFGGVISKRKFPSNQKPYQNHHEQKLRTSSSYPPQESFMVSGEEEPPLLEARTPTQRKTYAFMSKDPEEVQQLRQGRAYFNGWDGEQQPQQKRQHLKKHQQHSCGPDTYYHLSSEATEEVVFGAVQESNSNQGGVEIRHVDYGDPFYDHHGLRYRDNYMHYQNGY